MALIQALLPQGFQYWDYRYTHTHSLRMGFVVQMVEESKKNDRLHVNDYPSVHRAVLGHGPLSVFASEWYTVWKE